MSSEATDPADRLDESAPGPGVVGEADSDRPTSAEWNAAPTPGQPVEVAQCLDKVRRLFGDTSLDEVLPLFAKSLFDRDESRAEVERLRAEVANAYELAEIFRLKANVASAAATDGTEAT